MLQMRGSVLDRFMARVDKGAEGGCWQWTGVLQEGYGRFTVSPRYRARAHRWAYEHFIGRIPDGLVLDHLCGNRSCVNPSHLEPVTDRENILRGNTIAAMHAAKTHCVNGHEFTESNTRRRGPDGRWRVCLTCNRTYRRHREGHAV